MKIDKAEIERIIDDFETKSEKFKKEVSQNLGNKSVKSAFYCSGRSESLDYAAAVLRQVLHG